MMSDECGSDQVKKLSTEHDAIYIKAEKIVLFIALRLSIIDISSSF